MDLELVFANTTNSKRMFQILEFGNRDLFHCPAGRAMNCNISINNKNPGVYHCLHFCKRSQAPQMWRL